MKIAILDDYFDTLRTLALLSQARRPRRHGLDRPRPGRRRAGRAAARHRGARADPRAHADPRAAARAAAEAAADQPAQRLPAHRHRRLHAARHHRLVRPARRARPSYADRRADLGPRARGDAADPAADAVAAARARGRPASAARCAARRSASTATAGSARSSPATARAFGMNVLVWGARGVAGAGARATASRSRASKRGVLRAVRRRLAAPAARRRDARHRHRGRPRRA